MASVQVSSTGAGHISAVDGNNSTNHVTVKRGAQVAQTPTLFLSAAAAGNDTAFKTTPPPSSNELYASASLNAGNTLKGEHTLDIECANFGSKLGWELEPALPDNAKYAA
jgi:hypothetical protein